MARTDESIWVLEMRVIDHYCRAPRVIGKRYRHNIINRHRWTATMPSHHRTSLPPNLLSAVMNLQLSDPQWPKLGLVNTDTTHLVVADKRDHLKHQGPQPLLHPAFTMGSPCRDHPVNRYPSMPRFQRPKGINTQANVINTVSGSLLWSPSRSTPG